MDIFIAIIIIGLAVAYCGWTFYNKFQPEKGCGCGDGCNSCGNPAGADCLPEYRGTQPTATKK